MSQKKKNVNEKSETVWYKLTHIASESNILAERKSSRISWYGHFRAVTQSVHSCMEVNVAKIRVCEEINIMGHKWGWYGGHFTPRIPGQYLFEESSPQSKLV